MNIQDGDLRMPARSTDRRARSRQFRREQTAAEALLWQRLRNRRLGGYKFRRQAVIAPFIVDFCCFERRLIIEVDGAVHNEPQQMRYDLDRTAALEAAGFHILRFTNEDVEQQIGAVLVGIHEALEPSSSLQPSPRLAALDSPLPEGEGLGVRA